MKIVLPLNMKPLPSDQLKYSGIFGLGGNTSLTFIPLSNLSFSYQPKTNNMPLTYQSTIKSIISDQPMIALSNGTPLANETAYQTYIEQLKAQKAFTSKSVSEYTVLKYKFFAVLNNGYLDCTVIKGQRVLPNAKSASFYVSNGVVMSLLQVKYDYNIWPDVFSNSENQKSMFYVTEASEGSSNDISVSNEIPQTLHSKNKAMIIVGIRWLREDSRGAYRRTVLGFRSQGTFSKP